MRDSIEESIISRAVIRANTHYYEYQDAIELVELCRQEGIPVLGIDSFIITETKTQPFLEHSVDLSDCEDTHDKATVFLEQKKEYGFLFEVVY